MFTKTCPICKSEFQAQWSGRKHCSRKCSARTVANLLSEPVEDRFWRYVNKNGPIPEHRPDLGPCWEWTGARNLHDYGVIRVGGGAGKNILTHRLAWYLETGDWPLDHVLHHCDNPPCIRFSHHFTGDQRANILDMLAKGRGATGDRHPMRKNPELGKALAAAGNRARWGTRTK